MGFLNAIFMFGLVAMAVPIIIHLLNRRRIRKIRFSSLEFLSELAKRRMRKINLRRILILILRTLAVMLLVFAFARPTLRSAGFLIPGKAPKNVIVCLDVSYSMGVNHEIGTALTMARELAHSIVDQAGKNDLLNLVLFSDRPEELLEKGTRNRNLIKTAIDNAEPSAETTAIDRAITRAFELVDRSDVDNGEIYVVSDFRFNADSTIVTRRGPAPGQKEHVRVYLIPVYEEDADNVSIDRVTVPRKLLRPGEVIRVGVAISNHSREHPANFPLELSVGGKRKAEKVINLAPSAATTVTFPISFTEWGSYQCRVSKNRDRLPIDDDRHFILEVSKSVPVTLVRGIRQTTEEQTASFFYLEKALNPRGTTEGEFTVKTIDQRDLTAAALPKRGVVVWTNPQNLETRRLALLERYVKRGGSLMIFLGESDRRLWNNRRFRQFVGMRAADRKTNQLREGYTSFRRDHPVFSIFSPEELELRTRTRVKSYVAAIGVAPDSVLAYVGGGDPALWECSRGKGSVLVFAASPDLESGDIPLSPMFLPLVHTSVSYLAIEGGTRHLRENPVGQDLFFDIPEGEVSASHLLIRDPQGRPLKPVIYESPQGDKTQVICERTRAVGVFTLQSDTTVVAVAAVNLDTRESNLARSSLPEDGGAVVQAGPDFLDNLEEKRQGREVFAFFVLLVAVALVAESILGRKA